MPLLFDESARIRASIKRRPAPVNHRWGEPEVVVSVVLCTPFDPMDPQTRALFGTDIPATVWITYVGTQAVRKGDVLVREIDGQEFKVWGVNPWDDPIEGGFSEIWIVKMEDGSA